MIFSFLVFAIKILLMLCLVYSPAYIIPVMRAIFPVYAAHGWRNCVINADEI